MCVSYFIWKLTELIVCHLCFLSLHPSPLIAPSSRFLPPLFLPSFLPHISCNCSLLPPSLHSFLSTLFDSVLFLLCFLSLSLSSFLSLNFLIYFSCSFFIFLSFLPSSYNCSFLLSFFLSSSLLLQLFLLFSFFSVHRSSCRSEEDRWKEDGDGRSEGWERRRKTRRSEKMWGEKQSNRWVSECAAGNEGQRNGSCVGRGGGQERGEEWERKRRMRRRTAELLLFILVCAALSDALCLSPVCCRMTRQYQQEEREGGREGEREGGI